MKKFLAIAIVLVLMAGFMVGCNGNYENGNNENGNGNVNGNGYSHPSDIIGTWYGGVDGNMVFDDEGNGTWDAYREIEMIWRTDGANLILLGEDEDGEMVEFEFELSGDTLTITYAVTFGETEMVFTRG